ncbi:MAG: hypothetical protein EBX49_09435 [Synechococcaceae bacterium WB8_1B_136]|nr:hypothetical protein [Synechococcaceae bacterium WB8_1B_136]
MYGGTQPHHQLELMRQSLLGLLAAVPLALLASQGSAQANPWSYYEYSSPYSSFSMLNGPGGYSGYGFATPTMGMYSDNYGTTTCMAVGSSIMCF